MSVIETLPEAARERWRTAGRFAEVLEREVRTRQNPPAVRVVTWFNLCRLCQELEETLLLAEAQRPEELRLHRALLSLAMAAGEALLLEPLEAKELAPLGMTAESIQAKLDSLRITFEQWHTEANPQRQEAILREVFGGQA